MQLLGNALQEKPISPLSMVHDGWQYQVKCPTTSLSVHQRNGRYNVLSHRFFISYVCQFGAGFPRKSIVCQYIIETVQCRSRVHLLFSFTETEQRRLNLGFMASKVLYLQFQHFPIFRRSPFIIHHVVSLFFIIRYLLIASSEESSDEQIL